MTEPTLRRVEYAILQFGRGITRNIGVLLLDERDELHIRMLDDWAGFEDEDIEVLSALTDDLRTKAAELGPARLMNYLEQTLSNDLRITDRVAVSTDNPERELYRLFADHVESA